MGDQDGKTGVFEFVGKELKQKPVHEHTARERDGIEAFAITDLARDVGRSVRNVDVKPEGEPVGRHACHDSIQKSFDERLGVQDGGVVRRREYACMIAVETNGLTVKRAPGGGFEFYGGFALVGCLAADAQNRCCGIKETPHAAGARAVDAALDHGGCHAARLLVEAVQKPSGTRVLEQAELTEQGKGIAPGVAHGGRPAGERPGAQVRGALKAAKAGNKKLAAPNGPIGAGTRTIEGNTEDACIRRKPASDNRLCHYARDVRMMMLDFDKRQTVLPCPLTRPLAR